MGERGDNKLRIPLSIMRKKPKTYYKNLKGECGKCNKPFTKWNKWLVTWVCEEHSPMKIHIINYEQAFNNGILSKFAHKLHDELEKMKGIEVSIGNVPEPTADINHHINYLPYKHSGKINTLMVTHIWEGYKLDSLKKSMESADMGICMSSEMPPWLAKQGIDEAKLTYILPAHDAKPRRHQVVAILTNVYPDNCKREEMFAALVKTLNPNEWAFRIMGSGWSEILVPLVAEGLQVDYFAEFDPINHQRILETSDYCLYFGKDEGSMAILDATNAGLKTITTLQGFHKDIGIDYAFDTQEELNEIFKNLNKNPVKDWTWKKYAKEHLKIWKKLLK